MLLLKECLKKYSKELDKACPPEETVKRILDTFNKSGQEILSELKRIDTGRLGIPVYMSITGPTARTVMPTKKQMGKGASPVQAEASALMELAERFSYFTFWDNDANFERLTWSEAKDTYGSDLMDPSKILQSVHEELPVETAEALLDLVTWQFCKVFNVTENKAEFVPLNWFKQLNEFNGSCAGNTSEEAILQGGCELVERHVSARIDRETPSLPTLDPSTFQDNILKNLMNCYESNGIVVILKDFSLDMPVPTVGALAYDPNNFPGLSELVYTAGTAASPEKAAIRALTEVAQLAGDFETASNFEASGLSKYTSLDEISWLRKGEKVLLNTLPSIESDDIYQELQDFTAKLKNKGYYLYAAETTTPDLDVPAFFTFIPGFDFRERTPHASMGLFIGRILAEEYPQTIAEQGLQFIERIYPEGHFLPFYMGQLALRMGDITQAIAHFDKARTVQPNPEDKALAAFYAGYAHSLKEEWKDTLAFLDQTLELDPTANEYFNLRGVAHYKLEHYELAAKDFQEALNINSSTAMDYANLGMCYKHLGKEKMALDFLTLALEIDPSLEFAEQERKALQGL